MLKPLFLFALAIASVSLRAATIPATEDSSSSRGKLTAATNKAPTLPVDGTRRAFVFFDLTEIPAGTQIRYARLRIFFPTVVRPAGGLTLHKVTGQWNEQVTGAEPEYEATPIKTFAPAAVGAKRFISVDVTDTVKAWMAAPETNEGFAIAAVPGGTAKLTASVTIGAKEGTGSGYPAELEVEASTVDIPANLTLAGTTTGAFAGDGSGLNTLNASNLSSGTVASARLGGEYTNALTLSNVGNAISGTFTGSFVHTGDVNLQGNILKNAALGMLFLNASFQGADVDSSGVISWSDSDGYARLEAKTGAPVSRVEYRNMMFDLTMRTPIDKPGTFLSVRVGTIGVTPIAGHEMYVGIATAVFGNPGPSEGIFFKGIGSALKGVTKTQQGETVLDLATPLTAGTFYNLYALRKQNTVEFYVDGVLKGTSASNLPTDVRDGYYLKAINNGTAADLKFEVGLLTIGIPMF